MQDLSPVSYTHLVLREAVGKDGKIYRIGGDEFVVLIHDITDDGIEKVLKRIEKCRVKYNEENNVNLDFAKGVSLYTEGDTCLLYTSRCV